MATKAMPTAGVKLQRGDGAGTEVFTTIAEIRDLNGPSETHKLVDVTSLDSTAREFINGLADGGELSFDVNLSPTNTAQAGLRADFDARTKRNFKLLLTDDPTTPSTATFAALVTDFGLKASVDDAVKASVKLKVSGAVTWTWKTT